jgi:hypothetical protein
MGIVEIEYTNNSPDSLSFLYFHLWPNAYKNNNTALGKQIIESLGKGVYLNNNERNGYIDSLDFKIDGKQVNWFLDSNHIDICKVIPKEGIAPGKQILISTPFYVKLPSGYLSRLGHSMQRYIITQWYPKPAVYDSDGWHQMPYLDIGEYYSEFGDFDVSINLPKDYIVASTGNHIKEELKDNETKTIRIREENIHDFAWFAAKDFKVLEGEVMLPNTGRKVVTKAYYFTEDSILWQNSIDYINDAITYYSKWYGDYPYNNASAVTMPFSRSGMEYPGITIVSRKQRLLELELVLVHELGHNWFYGILGNNERKAPWMDEGVNTFSEIRYMNEKYPENKIYPLQMENVNLAKLADIEEYPFASLHQVFYQLLARRNLDLPTNSESEQLKGLSYSAMAYSKAGLAFYLLKDYLGDQMFDQIMQEYFKSWKYKHPKAENLRMIFETSSNKDLSWFFDDLVGSKKKLDYGIVKNTKDGILIKNYGEINSPIPIFTQSSTGNDTIYWTEGFSGKKLIEFDKNADIKLYDYNYPELNPNNNFARHKGLLKNIEDIQIRPVGILEKPGKTTLNVLPAIAWNNYNKIMLGGMIYSDVIPAKKWEYQILPMYSFGSKDLAGIGNIQYNFYPFQGFFQQINVNVSAKQFAFEKARGDNIERLKVGLNFLNKSMTSKNENNLKAEFIFVSNYFADWNIEPGRTSYFRVQYIQRNKRKVNPYSFKTDFHGNRNFIKASVEGNYRYVYQYKNGLDIRLFSGSFIHRNKDLNVGYNFALGGKNGLNDYLMDYQFGGRFETIESNALLANQFIKEEGGFASNYTYGLSESFLVSTNLSSSLPIRKYVPLQIYFNAALVGPLSNFGEEYNKTRFLYEGGLKFNIYKNTIEVYFPIFTSPEINNYLNDNTSNYFQRVRFMLDLNKLNVFELARNI